MSNSLNKESQLAKIRFENAGTELFVIRDFGLMKTSQKTYFVCLFVCSFFFSGANID